MCFGNTFIKVNATTCTELLQQGEPKLNMPSNGDPETPLLATVLSYSVIQ